MICKFHLKTLSTTKRIQRWWKVSEWECNWAFSGLIRTGKAKVIGEELVKVQLFLTQILQELDWKSKQVSALRGLQSFKMKTRV
jgi:hypothetical protein